NPVRAQNTRRPTPQRLQRHPRRRQQRRLENRPGRHQARPTPVHPVQKRREDQPRRMGPPMGGRRLGRRHPPTRRQRPPRPRRHLHPAPRPQTPRRTHPAVRAVPARPTRRRGSAVTNQPTTRIEYGVRNATGAVHRARTPPEHPMTDSRIPLRHIHLRQEDTVTTPDQHTAPNHDHTTGYPLYADNAELVVRTATGPEQWTGTEWNGHVQAAARTRSGVLERLIQCPPPVCTTTCPADTDAAPASAYQRDDATPDIAIEHPDDDHVEIYIGDELIASANHNDHGQSGMDAVEATAVAVRGALTARLEQVRAERDHLAEQLQTTRRQ